MATINTNLSGGWTYPANSSQLAQLQRQLAQLQGYGQTYTTGGSLNIGYGQRTPTSYKAPTLEAREEPISGWRSFGLTAEGKLQGVRQVWEGARLKAECGDAPRFFSRPEMAEFLIASTGIPGEIAEAMSETYILARKTIKTPNPCITHLQQATCSCGIYGRDKAELVTPEHFILAKCTAFGTVACDEDGNWRASDVEIDKLYINKGTFSNTALCSYYDFNRMAADLSASYGVPCEVVESIEGLK